MLDISRHVTSLDQLVPDLTEALEAITDVMGYDKGPGEEEWAEWCNKYLPLVQRYGLFKGTVGFG